MIWKRDPEVEAAEKLPDWQRFHRCCGEQKVFFDRIEKQGRGYKCDAFTTEPTRAGGWRAVHLATGTGKSVLQALADAYAGSGKEIPEAAALLVRGLGAGGVTMDDFDALISAADDFDDLL